jgi:uncharacterized protein
MWEKPARQRLSQNRLHLQHGPIDLVLKAWGDPASVATAEAAAWSRFQSILGELVAELPALRCPIVHDAPVESVSGRRMKAACEPFAPAFITPMAAVAGAVADDILCAMTSAARLAKAFVNDGGDIAVHLSPPHTLSLGVAGHYEADRHHPSSGLLRLEAGDGVGGVATSGADAAATMIANAVDCDDPGIVRKPASALDPDSDLGDRLVTVSVPVLAPGQRVAALQRGLAAAQAYRERGLIIDAALTLQGETCLLGSHITLEGRAA